MKYNQCSSEFNFPAHVLADEKDGRPGFWVHISFGPAFRVCFSKDREFMTGQGHKRASHHAAM